MNKYLLLVVLSLIFLLFGLHFFFASQLHAIYVEDATRYVCSAKQIYLNGLLEARWYETGFGFPLLVAVFYPLFGDFAFAAWFLSMFFGLASLFIIAISAVILPP